MTRTRGSPPTRPDDHSSRLLASKRVRGRISQVTAYALLVGGGILMFAPFLWMVSTSLKEPSLIFQYPPQWIPNPVKWGNYADALTALPFHRYALNTLVICLGAVTGQVLSGALSAYAFSRLRWPGRDLIFAIGLGTMMLPGAVTMIPTFLIFKELRWLDTLLPLIVPNWFGGSVFYVFMLRQFFLTIPTELEDAGRMDGASAIRIFASIMLPLVRPALAVVAIFTFLGTWNDFLGPLIYLNSPDMRTLALGLAGLQGSRWGRDMTELLMAVSTVMIVPVIAVFLMFQKVFIQGIALTGIKG